MRYRPIQPVGAIGAYVQRLAPAGSLVIDLFCQGPTVLREAAEAGRRALGFSVNPLLLVAARLGLGRRDVAALNAAFTRLADSPKGDLPLHRYVASLYASACPVCGASGVAAWFAWDRDAGYPFKKAVRCPACATLREGDPDEIDIERARRFLPRGLAYYYALDRAAPAGHPARERAAELVGLYTPRNLSALMDLTMRLEALETGEEERIALTAALLDCFDACASLDPYEGERARPRTLRVPSAYIERNVWQCFEEGFARLLSCDSLPVPRAADVAALLGGEGGRYALVGHAARDAKSVVRQGSAALVVVDPPRPDAVFWALSALWANWLWESPAARRMRPFLRRRRFEWDWHWRVLQAALQVAGPLLTPEGYLLVLFSDADTALLESVCLAASEAGFRLEGWGYNDEAGYRLVWRWSPRKAGAAKPRVGVAAVEILERQIEAAAAEAAVRTLRERGEPARWPFLHASVYTTLAGRGLLSRAVGASGERSPLALVAEATRRVLESGPITRIAEQHEDAARALWWLTDSGRALAPLADRVEEHIWRLLVQRAEWDVEELLEALYARFAACATPDLALASVCLDSYGVLEGGKVRLRPEDEPRRRAAEIKALRRALMGLGKRLGFQAKGKGGWDVRWLEEGREAYAFALSASATLAQYLLADRHVEPKCLRCLVLPGGRASLVSFKLQRDPRLTRVLEERGWQFIKFRHVRRLVAEKKLDRYVLRTVLGLDPIAEREAAQIPLF